MTVWVLYLNRPENFACGPYATEEAGVAAGRGRVEPPHPGVMPGAIQVRDGLLVPVEGAPEDAGLRRVFVEKLVRANGCKLTSL